MRSASYPSAMRPLCCPRRHEWLPSRICELLQENTLIPRWGANSLEIHDIAVLSQYWRNLWVC